MDHSVEPTALVPEKIVRPPAGPPARRRFLTALFALAHDPSPAVRKAVCTGLVALLMCMPERLQPSMPDLIEYMLQSTQVWLGCAGVARA